MAIRLATRPAAVGPLDGARRVLARNGDDRCRCHAHRANGSGDAGATTCADSAHCGGPTLAPSSDAHAVYVSISLGLSLSLINCSS